MMNQGGMLGNPFGGAPAPAPQMGGMGNLLQQGMMNPGMAGAMGMMGGGGGMGGIQNLNGMGGLDGGLGGGNANAPAQGSNNHEAPAPPGAPPSNNSNDLLVQLMQNPLAMQMISQGMNPLAILGGMGGGLGQNPLGAVGANPLGALGLGGLGASLGPGLGHPGLGAGGGGLNGMMPNSTLSDGTTAPHPNALFAFNNPMPQAMLSKSNEGILQQAPTIKGKKNNKKTKVKGKPKRPLSAYNFFFREERSRILDSLPKSHPKKKKKKGADESGDEEEKKVKDSKERKPVKGDKDYDQVGDDGKKIPHGKIGFENLAKLIGKRWQELDADGSERYKKLADEDMARYKKEMEVFLTKEAQGGVDGNLIASSSAAMSYSVLTGKRKADDDDGGHLQKKLNDNM